MIDAALHARIDDLFRTWDRPDSPGCALGIIADGELVVRRGYGCADLEQGTPIDGDSVFYIASTSKQFAAAAVRLLELDGAVSMGDRVRGILPELPAALDGVTVADLVHHTSGIRDYIELFQLRGATLEDEWDNADVVDLLAGQQRLNFEPGTRYQYSNSNYVLMAEVVQRVSGSTLRVFAHDRIFEPLGMRRTRFDDDHREIVPGRVTSYERTADGDFRHYLKAIDVVGDGNVLTTVDDLVRWDANFTHERVGGPGFTELMTRPGRFRDGTEGSYASGLLPARHRGLEIVSHNGGFAGFRAELLRFPEQRVSVVLLANLAEIDAPGLAREVADLFLESRGVALDARPAVPAPAPSAPPVDIPSADLAEIVGEYVSTEVRTTRSIVLEDGRLRMIRRRPHGYLTPTAPDTFGLDGLGLVFRATRDDRGSVDGLEVSSRGVEHLRLEKLSAADARRAS